MPFIEDLSETVQVVWSLLVMIGRSMPSASLLKGLWQVPRWQVARMWLGDPSAPSNRGHMGAYAYYEIVV